MGRTQPQPDIIITPPVFALQTRCHSRRVLPLPLFEFLGLGSAHCGALYTLTPGICRPGTGSWVGAQGLSLRLYRDGVLGAVCGRLGIYGDVGRVDRGGVVVFAREEMGGRVTP